MDFYIYIDAYYSGITLFNVLQKAIVYIQEQEIDKMGFTRRLMSYTNKCKEYALTICNTDYIS